MINPDNLQAGQIQQKLQSKEFILIKNGKNNHELWNQDISLIGQMNVEGTQQVFDGWAACNHCFTAYRTHSKTNRPDFCRIFASLTSKINRPDFHQTGPDKF